MSQLVAEDGGIMARYEYDPFGNKIVGSGDAAAENPFRFSTKYYDAETGLVYYGFRYYSPELGRWTAQDPIEENGGINLYVFVNNDSINLTDILGLWDIERKGRAAAVAKVQNGDTLTSLAAIIGLDINEYREWAEVGNTGVTTQNHKIHYNISSLGPADQLRCGEIIIPNLIVAYWAGDLNIFGIGRGYVNWGDNIGYLRKLGFGVIDRDFPTAATVEQDAKQKTAKKELHGIYMWGHGWHTPGGFWINNKNYIKHTDYASWLKYRLGLGIMAVCFSSGMDGSSFNTGGPGYRGWTAAGFATPLHSRALTAMWLKKGGYKKRDIKRFGISFAPKDLGKIINPGDQGTNR